MAIHPAETSRGGNDYEKVIQRLTLEIRKGAPKAKSLSSACIYRVPRELRKLNESAYTPRLIAIGPLHRNDEHLQTPMQHVKMSYMNDLLCRMTQGMENQEAEQEQKKILQECVAEMKTSLDDAKKCYAEEVSLDVEMMLVDGCFILEFLYRFRLYYSKNVNLEEGEDPIVSNPSTHVDVQHDLILQENQIPFFVLQKLFTLTLARIPNKPPEEGKSTNRKGKSPQKLLLTDYVFLPFVDQLMRPEEKSTNRSSTETSCWPCDCVLLVSGNKMNNSKPEEGKSTNRSTISVSGNKMNNSSRNDKYHYHILHKIHDDFHPHDQTGTGKLRQIMPSASELLYGGVKFESGTGNDLFQVKFIEPEGPFRWFLRARFQIPAITLQDSTEPYLRNFIAFEQCSPGISQNFMSYAMLMDMLVNSDIDVQVLEKAGIVDNWLGASEDVTDLFNKLLKEVTLSKFLFNDTCIKATRYSKRFWPNHMAYLRRQYFASPWKFIAFCLAFLYSGINIAQFIISILK